MPGKTPLQSVRNALDSVRLSVGTRRIGGYCNEIPTRGHIAPNSVMAATALPYHGSSIRVQHLPRHIRVVLKRQENMA
ncbi:MAG: hypothetical protein ABI167_10140 [Nitrosospira sp.]